MLFSLAVIFLLGMFLGGLCKRLHLPSLLGMILTGVLLGPYAFDLLDSSILTLSSDLRRIALLIILTRAGLSLNLKDLKKVGRPAILMCFLPACFEILGVVLLAPRLLSITTLEAGIVGTVIAAVSPAVIVPKMLKLTQKGYGTAKGIPQLILAGASVDDVFVIVLFTALIGLAQGETISPLNLLQIPLAILMGILVGFTLGYLLAKYFEKVHIRDSAKVIILLSTSFLLVTLEDCLPSFLPFSGLIAVMSAGIALQQKNKIAAAKLSRKFSKLWVGAEILLFVLVGATIDLSYALSAGLSTILLIFLVLLFRMLGVFCCFLKTKLTLKERLFCMIGYTPKATVQAAIGGIPLALGLSCGNIVLTVAVWAILITAPFGAFFIDFTYKKLLTADTD